MSWPILFAQTPGTPVEVATPVAPPAAPATPDAPVAPATPPPVQIDAPIPPVDAPATPVVPADQLNTPATPVTDMTPVVQQPAQNVQYESIQTGGLGGVQWVVLVIFAGVCVGLITCVLFSTSKSDLGGAIVGGGATAPFRGKKSGEEQLTQITTWFATAFIVMSLAMAFVFRF